MFMGAFLWGWLECGSLSGREFFRHGRKLGNSFQDLARCCWRLRRVPEGNYCEEFGPAAVRPLRGVRACGASLFTDANGLRFARPRCARPLKQKGSE